MDADESLLKVHVVDVQLPLPFSALYDDVAQSEDQVRATPLKCSVHLSSCSCSVVSIAFPLYPQWRVSGSALLAADQLDDLVHLSLLFPVGGLFCLTCLVFHLDTLVFPCHPLQCPVCFLILLPVSLFQPV